MLYILKIPASLKETTRTAAMFFWTLSVIQSEVMKYFPTQQQSTLNPAPAWRGDCEIPLSYWKFTGIEWVARNIL